MYYSSTTRWLSIDVSVLQQGHEIKSTLLLTFWSPWMLNIASFTMKKHHSNTGSSDMGLQGSPSPFKSIYHYVKFYFSSLHILNVVFDFCALPQIMFVNMWISISSFENNIVWNKFWVQKNI